MIGFGVYQPVETGGLLDVCLCIGCGVWVVWVGSG